MALEYAQPQVINPTGLTPENLAKYQEALQASMDSLQARYANPNWFNVAAGFLKPQLGGFAASLGSAGAALGDWQEKQRANELPVAQMRAELGRVGMMQEQANQAGALAEKHRGKMTPEISAQITQLQPGGSAALSSAKELEFAQNSLVARSAARKEFADVIAYYNKRGLAIPDSVYTDAGMPVPGKTAMPSSLAAGAPDAVPSKIPGPALSGATGPSDTEKVAMAESLRAIAKLPPQQAAAAYADLRAHYPKSFDLPGGESAVTTQPTTSPPVPEGKTSKTLPRAYSIPPTGLSDPELEILKNMNAGHMARFNAISTVGSSEAYAQHASAVKTALALIDKNPVLAAKVTGVLQQHTGAIGGLLQAIQTGLGVSAGPLTGQVHADAASILRGTLPKEEQAYASALSTALAKAGLAQQAATGVNPSTVRAGEVSTVVSAGPSINKPVDALRLELQHTLADLDTAKTQHSLVESFVANQHPLLKKHPETKTPYSDIITSDEFKGLSERNARLRNAITQNYLSTLNKGNKP